MRPRVLYELSQELALLVERGIEDQQREPLPVFLCHPLDPFEAGEEAESAVGVLYLSRLVPQRHFAPGGPGLEPSAPGESLERLRLPSLWLQARYVFLVGGGDLETQLSGLAGALQTLHDTPEIRLGERQQSWPLRLVDGSEAWREVGLPEHRLTIAFEVGVEIPSACVESVDRTLEREVVLQPDRPPSETLRTDASRTGGTQR